MLLICSNIQNIVRMSGGYFTVRHNNGGFQRVLTSARIVSHADRERCLGNRPYEAWVHDVQAHVWQFSVASTLNRVKSGPGSALTIPEVVRLTTDGVSRTLSPLYSHGGLQFAPYVVPPRQTTGAAVTKFIVHRLCEPAAAVVKDDGWSRLTDDQASPPRVGHATRLDVQFECPPSWPEKDGRQSASRRRRGVTIKSDAVVLCHATYI